VTDEPKRCAHDGCKLIAEEGSDLCILHQPTPKDVERFKAVLYAQLDEEGPEDERNRQFWFEQYVFPVRLVVWEARGEASDDTIALPACLNHASFLRATFAGSADFRGATFAEPASFRLVKFSHFAIFSGATFESIADFSGAEFAGGAFFDGAQFAGSALFHGTRFAGDTTFNGAKCVGALYFTDGLFKERVGFFATEAAHLSLGSGKPHIPGWGHGRCGVRLEDFGSAPSFWRFARRTYTALGEREKADAAFYFERVAKRKAQRAVNWPSHEGIRWCGWGPWLMKCLFRTILKAWPTLVWAVECVSLRWTSAYGRSLSRVATTSIAVIIAFGVWFSASPSVLGYPHLDAWTWPSWSTGLAHSASAFVTLGLTRVAPGSSVEDQLPCGRALTSLEGVAGALLIALGAMILRRKLMHES